MKFSFLMFILIACTLSAQADNMPAPAPPLPSSFSAGIFDNGALPFSFKYDGKDFKDIVSGWQKNKAAASATDGQIQNYTYVDPTTHLKVVCAVRTFDKYDAVDWVLTFTNEGTSDTPIIENILPLHWTMTCDSSAANIHTAQGSNAAVEDFKPRSFDLWNNQTVQMSTNSGRSSDGDGFPFFNLQTGDHGIFGAIGWTGDWQAHFNRDQTGKTITMDAGMLATHLLLHPGETIRSPRILLLNWKGGDVTAAQNLWRQLMINEYSPRDADGKPAVMPISWDTWGTEFASVKLKAIQGMVEQKIPADLYWIDAGWYEPISLAPNGGYDTGSQWDKYRGDWILSKNLYPNSMKPLGDALKAAGIGFLVWFEAETTNQGMKNLAAHPDWYLLPANSPAYLNLGNPEARKWITDLVSQFITDNGLTWYRQDFNFSPAGYWQDKPDRVGMAEIESITGLYQYWDDLRARHPGLRIDNCASGGRRLDIETAARSVSLWRSDNSGDPIGEQFHTLSLTPWYPMNAAVWPTLKGSNPPPHGNPTELYQQRSGYGPGMTVCVDQDPAPWIKTAFDEFREVRPYYMGDFYPILGPSSDPTVWSVWQLQATDHKSGVVVLLRRPDSLYPTVQLDLKALDPNASYSLDIRTSLDKSPPTILKGSDLAHLSVTLHDKPGSELIFYHRQ